MKKIFTLTITAICLLSSLAKAQNIFPQKGRVGIFTTTPNVSAALDIDTTGLGLLIPRMTKAQRDAIVSPATSLLIYQTTNPAGFYYYDGSKWAAISTKGANTSLSNLGATSINQNLIADSANIRNIGSYTKQWNSAWFDSTVSVNYINIGRGAGNQENSIAIGGSVLSLNTTGYQNIVLGDGAMYHNTSGYSNIAIGLSAMDDNTSGSHNVTTGNYNMNFNKTGSYNAAYGDDAFHANKSGNYNTAIGANSLFSNDSGSYNVAIGYDAMKSNNVGNNNVAIGNEALALNTDGHDMIAIGNSALYNQSINGIGEYYNIALGTNALYSNISGSRNIATGDYSLYSNTTGGYNLASGGSAMYANITGSYNTAFGAEAMPFSKTGNYNSCFGFYSYNDDGTSNTTALGNGAHTTANNQVRIGNGSVSSIGGQVSWTTLSDGRVKKNIKENVPGLAFINKLKPVTYNLDLNAVDKLTQTILPKDAKGNVIKPSAEETEARKAKEQIVYTGLIAQDVEKIAKETGYNFSGVDAAKNEHDLYGLRYSDFVMPLIKSVQELSKQSDAKGAKN